MFQPVGTRRISSWVATLGLHLYHVHRAAIRHGNYTRDVCVFSIGECERRFDFHKPRSVAKPKHEIGVHPIEAQICEPAHPFNFFAADGRRSDSYIMHAGKIAVGNRLRIFSLLNISQLGVIRNASIAPPTIVGLPLRSMACANVANVHGNHKSSSSRKHTYRPRATDIAVFRAAISPPFCSRTTTVARFANSRITSAEPSVEASSTSTTS